MRLVRFGKSPGFEMQELADPVPGPGEVVIAVGGGVKSPALGDEVVIYPAIGWPEGAEVPGSDFDILGGPSEGTFAERVVVPASHVAARPERLTWSESGALPLSGLTAWRALMVCGRAKEGDAVLATGGGSGVSTFLIQLGVAAGARVFVTTGSELKASRSLALGAEQVALYSDPDWPDAIARSAGPLDIVIDSYGSNSFALALPLLRRGGRFVSFGDTGGPSTTFDVAEVYWEWRSIIGTSMGSPSEFRSLLGHVADALWRPVVDSEYPLERLDEAADRLESPERFGKVVVTVTPE